MTFSDKASYLMWEPWIGSRFHEKRILILGESCYDWVDKEVEYKCQPDHPAWVIRTIQKDSRDSAATMLKLTRAICKTNDPTPQQSSDRWERFAYTNYIPTSMLSAQHRPKTSDWDRGAEEWGDVLRTINPRLVLVLGRELWGRMPETYTHSISKNIQGYATGSNVAMCFAVRHPSFGPSWTRFAEWIDVLENGYDLNEMVTRFRALDQASYRRQSS